MGHWDPLSCKILNKALREGRIARDLIKDLIKVGQIWSGHQFLDQGPQLWEVISPEM